MTAIVIDTNLNKRKFECLFPGCYKAYAKSSRLQEHGRSHTNERPFVCTVCGKSFLRETHLRAHSRSHLPVSSRPLQCSQPGCSKRFWTYQHLRVHENVHHGEKQFQCHEPDCDEGFSKRHQLRAHICIVHAPPGTKPYMCTHPECTKSFVTNQKLRAHLKVHDEHRYLCSHPDCFKESQQLLVHFPTWAALQSHMRTVHPPTCSHPSCHRKTFTTQRSLKVHLKLHEQRDVEFALDKTLLTSNGDVGGHGADDRPRKRRRGGEIGRDWQCDFTGCEKDFKSEQALMTHRKVNHLGCRDFICSHDRCCRAFGYKHLLQRHVVKEHGMQTVAKDDSNEGSALVEGPNNDSSMAGTQNAILNIDMLTGVSYAQTSLKLVKNSTAIQCPFPKIDEITGSQLDTGSSMATQGEESCDFIFKRAYDLRRHLSAEHGVAVSKDILNAWVARMKGLDQD